MSGASSGRVAVAAPLAEEARPLLARLSGARRIASTNAWQGRLGEREVTVVITGDGAAAARRGLERGIAGGESAGLIVIGLSAGLSPDLQPETVVVAERILDADEVLEPDRAWLSRLPHRGVRGAVISGSRILVDRAAKAAARQRSGTSTTAVFDLESATLAAVAAQREIPYLVLRAVSDSMDEDLPLNFEACRDAEGRLDRRRVVLRALARPRAIPALVALARRTRRCAVALADAVETAVRVAP